MLLPSNNGTIIVVWPLLGQDQEDDRTQCPHNWLRRRRRAVHRQWRWQWQWQSNWECPWAEEEEDGERKWLMLPMNNYYHSRWKRRDDKLFVLRFNYSCLRGRFITLVVIVVAVIVQLRWLWFRFHGIVIIDQPTGVNYTLSRYLGQDFDFGNWNWNRAGRGPGILPGHSGI